MRVVGEDEPGEPDGASAPRGLMAAFLTACARLLEAEQDRWTLWVPMLFAAGILAYFALADEPAMRLALALLIGALGLSLSRGEACTARALHRRRGARLCRGLRRRQAPHRDGARAGA